MKVTKTESSWLIIGSGGVLLWTVTGFRIRRRRSISSLNMRFLDF